MSNFTLKKKKNLRTHLLFSLAQDSVLRSYREQRTCSVAEDMVCSDPSKSTAIDAGSCVPAPDH